MGKGNSLRGGMAVSEDGRHFVGGGGDPLFWLGDTQWELFRSYSLADAAAILEDRKRKGFTAVQVMLVGVDPEENVDGELPWHAGDPLRPNEEYFRHVDAVLELNRDLGGPNLVVGVFHACRMKGIFNESNARPWAEWVARRYGGREDLVWSMYPRAVAEDVPVCRALAEGLRTGDGGSSLITAHPDPSPTSSGSMLHEEDWLAFNCIQTFKSVELIPPMIAEDCSRTPVKPVVMAEGAYEAGTEYGFDVTPLWIRRQAYYSYLCGAHHSYGHNDSWRLLATWRKALDAPGARQMSILRRALEGLDEWWRMVPDASLLGGEARTEGRILDLAARHPEGKWALAYAGGPTTLSVNTEAVAVGGATHATWIDPATGESVPAGEPSVPAAAPLATPEGWEDALLLIAGT